MLRLARNRTSGLLGMNYCIVKFSSQWRHIVIEILPSTDIHQANQKSSFWSAVAVGVLLHFSINTIYRKIKLTNTIYSVTMNVTLISVRSQEPHQMFLFR